MRWPWVSREMHEAVCAEKDARIDQLLRIAGKLPGGVETSPEETLRSPLPLRLLPSEVEDAIRRNTYGNSRIAKRNRDFARKSLADGKPERWIVDEIDKGEEA